MIHIIAEFALVVVGFCVCFVSQFEVKMLTHCYKPVAFSSVDSRFLIQLHLVRRYRC
jgi:hypothetical protein